MRTLFYLLFGCLILLLIFAVPFIIGEKIIEKNPNSKFAKWWKENIVSDQDEG